MFGTLIISVIVILQSIRYSKLTQQKLEFLLISRNITETYPRYLSHYHNDVKVDVEVNLLVKLVFMYLTISTLFLWEYLVLTVP